MFWRVRLKAAPSLPLYPNWSQIMAYIEVGEEKIEPATDADLDRLFDEKRILGIAVFQDSRHGIQASVTGRAALVLYLDQKKVTAQKPEGHVDRDGALQILKSYLKDGSLDADFTWIDAELPTVETGSGCLSKAALIAVTLTCLVAVVAGF